MKNNVSYCDVRQEEYVDVEDNTEQMAVRATTWVIGRKEKETESN